MCDQEKDDLELYFKKIMAEKFRELADQEPIRTRLRELEAAQETKRIERFRELLIQKSNDAEAVFYCLYTLNKKLVDKRENEIALKCAKHMRIKHFLIRSGPEVQDPVSLFEEVQLLDPLCYNFILIDVNTGNVTYFGEEDWRRFMKLLKAYKPEDHMNSGELAKLALTEE